MTTTSSRDSSFLLQPSLRWSQRTAGLSRAATISAATKGANRDSRGGPSLATSTTAAPSLSWQALPAVTVPPSLSFLKAGCILESTS